MLAYDSKVGAATFTVILDCLFHVIRSHFPQVFLLISSSPILAEAILLSGFFVYCSLYWSLMLEKRSNLI